MTNLWIRVQSGTDPGDEEGPQWYHVSPWQVRNGTMLKPGTHPANFEDSSPHHTYLTGSRERAEQYRYHLWELGYPEQHLYEVHPHGPVEEDPNDPDSHRTKHPVQVLWHLDADDDDNGWND